MKVLALTPGTPPTQSAEPTPVTVTIPHDLIRMAIEYPAIDWNEVMRYAINGWQPNAEAKASELAWTIEPKPYLMANGQDWWDKPSWDTVTKEPSTEPAKEIQAAVHGKRSDGQRVFKVISLPATATDELKSEAQAYALKILREKGLWSDDLLIADGALMPQAEAYTP